MENEWAAGSDLRMVTAGCGKTSSSGVGGKGVQPYQGSRRNQKKSHSCGFSLPALRFLGCVAGDLWDWRGQRRSATTRFRELAGNELPATASRKAYSSQLFPACDNSCNNNWLMWNKVRIPGNRCILGNIRCYNTDARQSHKSSL